MGSVDELKEKEAKVIDRVIELSEDKEVIEETLSFVEKNNQLKRMIGTFDIEEILQLNPIEVADTIEKEESASDKVKELAKLLREMVDVNHALAAKEKPEEMGGD